MSLRRPIISKKIGKHRYALLTDMSLSLHEAQTEAKKLRASGKSARILKMTTGWFVYYYPQ